MGISARDVLVEVSDEKVIQEKQEVVQSVSLTVSRIYSELAIGVGTELEILINITWQLQQCLRDELESNPNLGSVLTISGDALHSWAAPCSEYVEVTWGTFGLRLFKDFEICLREVLRDIGEFYDTGKQCCALTNSRQELCSIAERTIGKKRNNNGM